MLHAESRPPTPRCAPQMACFALQPPSRGLVRLNERCVGVSVMRESAHPHRSDATSHASPTKKLTMPPRCAEMYRERDVPRNVVRCLAMPREHKEDSSSRYRTLQGKKIFQNLPLSTRSFLATKGDLSPRYRTLREKKSSKTFHYLLVLFSLLALYGKLLREDGVFYRS